MRIVQIPSAFNMFYVRCMHLYLSQTNASHDVRNESMNVSFNENVENWINLYYLFSSNFGVR